MSKVAIVLRVRRADGTRGHYSAVETPNGRLKPFWGKVNGNPEHLPGSAYYLRYSCELLSPIPKVAGASCLFWMYISSTWSPFTAVAQARAIGACSTGSSNRLGRFTWKT
jgi:hypothetical protein